MKYTNVVLFRLILAMLPVFIGVLKTDWYIAPLLILNAMVQGAAMTVDIYRIRATKLSEEEYN